MKSQKNTILTSSTIDIQQTDLTSHEYINLGNLANMNNQSKSRANHRANHRAVSILSQQCTNNSNQLVLNGCENIVSPRNMHKKTTITKNVQIRQNTITKNVDILSVLQKIFFKKKRYCFQILKQFILFPDDTQSSIMSLSTYDPLIFKDEIIHSLVKILETKMIQNKIWAFINLRMMPYLKAAIQIQEKATKAVEKKVRFLKKESFDIIRKASQDVYLRVQSKSRTTLINSFIQTSNQQTQCDQQRPMNPSILKVEQKQNKNYLSSKIIQHQYAPSSVCQSRPKIIKYQETSESNVNYIPTKIVQQRYSPHQIAPVTHMNSTVKILTTEEYMNKYALKSNNPSTTNVVNRVVIGQTSSNLKNVHESSQIHKVNTSSYEANYQKNKQSYIQNIIQPPQPIRIYTATDHKNQYQRQKHNSFIEQKSFHQPCKRQTFQARNKDQSPPSTKNYNIIHYYQKPQVINSHNFSHSKKSILVQNSSCQASSCNHVHSCQEQYNNKCCQNSFSSCCGYKQGQKCCNTGGCNCRCSCQSSMNRICSHKKDISCCQTHHCLQRSKQSKINQTRFTQNYHPSNYKISTQLIENKENTFLEAKQNSRSLDQVQNSFPEYDLSQLQSRIQYLNFLRKIAQKQEEDQQRAKRLKI